MRGEARGEWQDQVGEESLRGEWGETRGEGRVREAKMATGWLSHEKRRAVLAGRLSFLPAPHSSSPLPSGLAIRLCSPMVPPHPPIYKECSAPPVRRAEVRDDLARSDFRHGRQASIARNGKRANVVVTTGGILEARTDTKYLFIDGRPVPLDTRHTEPFMQFKDRP